MKYLRISFIVFTLLLAPSVEADQTFKVGVILGLTGVYSEYGQAMQNGIEMARSEQPELFNNINFIYEDVALNAAMAALAFKKLAAQDQVNLTYSFGVHLSKAVAPLAEQLKIPLVAQSIDPSISIDSDFVTRFFNSAQEYAELTSNYLEKNSINNIAIVVSEDSYLTEVYNQLKNQLPNSIKINFIEYVSPTEKDFRSIISKIRGNKHKAVGVLLSGGQIAPFYKQLNEQGISIKTFGSNIFESSSEINESHGTMEGAVFPNNYVYPEFTQKYLEKFGNTSQITFAACAYEFAKLIALTASDDPDLRGEQLVNKLRQTSRLSSTATSWIQYTYTITGGHYFKMPLVLKTIKDGRVKNL